MLRLFPFIARRTERAFFRLLPSKDFNRVAGGILARYAEIFKITAPNRYCLLHAPLSALLKAESPDLT